MTSEKFCLRWNEYERNISEAFREFRDDSDFFDITLACEEEQVQAHKLILSACSPFFKQVLHKHTHSHPLLYLKGVKYVDLEAVLNFMYHGQVNVAQDELNSFLQVAEDLKVKGLSQVNTKNKTDTSSELPSEESNSKIVSKCETGVFVDPPDRSCEPPPNKMIKRALDIEELQDTTMVIPIKSEPCDEGEFEDNYPGYPYEDGSVIAKQEVSENDFQCVVYKEVKEKKLIPCERCEKQFTHRGALNLHIRSVHEGVVHPCEQCDHKASTKGSLKVHIQSIHEGIRYPCDQCQYKATTKNSLNIHVRSIHEGVRYPCQLCDYQATEKQKLNKHIKFVHEGIFLKCDYCEYKTGEKRKLRSHLKTRHSVQGTI